MLKISKILNWLNNSGNRHFILSIIIISFTVLAGYNQSEAENFDFLNTKIYLQAGSSFQVNSQTVKTNADDENTEFKPVSNVQINVNDLIQTENDSLKIVMNDMTMLIIKPNSYLRLIEMGDLPRVDLIEGEVELQTVSNAQINSDKNKILIDEGGVTVNKNELASIINNYYGSVRVDISSNKDESLSYFLPLKKQITVFNSVNKTGWKNLAMDKLSDELRKKSIKDDILRVSFNPNFQISNEQIRSPGLLNELLAHSPKGKERFKEAQWKNILSDLAQAVAEGADKKVSRLMSELGSLEGSTVLRKLKRIKASIQDPLTRYTFETKLKELAAEDTMSINTEIKYLYTALSLDDEKLSNALYQALEEKIIKLSNQDEKLVESLGLLTAFAETYPEIFDTKLVKIKRSLEKSSISNAKSENDKQAIIISSLDSDLKLIDIFVRSGNKESAKAISNSILIDNSNSYNKLAGNYIGNFEQQRQEAKLMLEFQSEHLHAAAFNQRVYEKFKDRKNSELDSLSKAYEQYSFVNEEDLSEEDFYNLDNIINLFAENNLILEKEHLTFVHKEGNEQGKLLFSDQIKIGFGTEAEKAISFSAVYLPKEKVITDLLWEKSSDYQLPPMKKSKIPLNSFQSTFQRSQKDLLDKKVNDLANIIRENNFNTLEAELRKIPVNNLDPNAEFGFSIQREKAEQELNQLESQLRSSLRSSFVSDWAEDTPLSEFSISSRVNKRLSKEKLYSNGIFSKENNMKIDNDTLEIKDAAVKYKNEEEIEEVVFFDLEMQVSSSQVKSFKLQDSDEKINVNSMSELKDIVIAADIDKKLKTNLQEKASQDFIRYVQGELDPQLFTIVSLEEKIVRFTDLPMFIDKEDTYYLASGEYNIEKRIISKIIIDNQGSKRVLYSVKINDLKSRYETPTVTNDSSSDENSSDDEVIYQEYDLYFDPVEETLDNGDWL